jgi:hypothetical protein
MKPFLVCLGALATDNRCEDRRKVGELEGDIGAIRSFRTTVFAF